MDILVESFVELYWTFWTMDDLVKNIVYIVSFFPQDY